MSDGEDPGKGEVVKKAVTVAVAVFFFAITLFVILVIVIAKFATKTH